MFICLFVEHHLHTTLQQNIALRRKTRLEKKSKKPEKEESSLSQ